MERNFFSCYLDVGKHSVQIPTVFFLLFKCGRTIVSINKDLQLAITLSLYNS